MKRLILVVVMIAGIAGMSVAEETAGAYFKAGSLELTYPLANAQAIALYDFWKGEGLMGAETKLAAYHALNLNFGAVTSFESNGMPFVSLDLDFGQIMTNAPSSLARFGVWYGHDFKANDNRAGVKASVPLWGSK